MTITLISHFYNEELLLPFWLDHHLRMFDHGILINYKSTDASLSIIRKMAPRWEVRNSENEHFDAFKCDNEVMKIEGKIDGWKIALNTTEFIVNRNLHKSLAETEDVFPGIIGFTTGAAIVVDRPEDVGKPLTSEPLIFQRHYGWHDPPACGSRHRFIHRAKHGFYSLGRHHTQHTDVYYNPDIYTCWYGWCPYPQVKKRKLQIQTKIPPYHRGSGIGKEHEIDEPELDRVFDINSKLAVDLLAFDSYAYELKLCKEHYYPELCEARPADQP